MNYLIVTEMSKLLSKRLKDQRGIYAVLTALNSESLEKMIVDAEALEKQVEELNKINEDQIDWKGLLVDHCTQCGYPRSNREYQTLEAKFEALEKQNKELKITDCNCTPEETTGWITFRLCNICGKIQKK